MKLTLLFFLFPFISIGQTTFKGKIVNKRTNQPIAYATIGLMEENIGITADENGHFELISLKVLPKDSFIISCLGYKVSKISVNDFSNAKNVIQLVEQSFNMKEIVISNKNDGTDDTLNSFAKCSNAYDGTTEGGYQIAQHFKTRNENVKLMKIKICDGSLFYGKRGVYRIRIYTIDSISKAPSLDLCAKVIEVKSTGRYINLKKYKIVIPDKDFFIAIEWLKIKRNWNKTMFKNIGGYFPLIGHIENKGLTLESWQMSYNGAWLPRPKSTLLISAIIKN